MEHGKAGQAQSSQRSSWHSILEWGLCYLQVGMAPAGAGLCRWALCLGDPVPLLDDALGALRQLQAQPLTSKRAWDSKNSSPSSLEAKCCGCS